MRGIFPEHRVALKREIRRVDVTNGRQFDVYAKEGDQGTVIQCFQNDDDLDHTWYVKVLMDDINKIKTFRITSLKRLD